MKLKKFALKAGIVVVNGMQNKKAVTTICSRNEVGNSQPPIPQNLISLDGSEVFPLQSTSDNTEGKNSTYHTAHHLVSMINDKIDQHGTMYVHKSDFTLPLVYGADEVTISGEITEEDCGYVSTGKKLTIRQYSMQPDGDRKLLSKQHIKGSRIVSLNKVDSGNCFIQKSLSDTKTSFRFMFASCDPIVMNVSQELMFGKVKSIKLAKGGDKNIYPKQMGFLVAAKTKATIEMQDGSKLKLNLKSGTHIYAEVSDFVGRVFTLSNTCKRVIMEQRYAMFRKQVSYI